MNNIKGKAYYISLRAKYLNYAKEAMASGDRVLSEYNLQYADHYNRIISEKFPSPNNIGMTQGSETLNACKEIETAPRNEKPRRPTSRRRTSPKTGDIRPSTKSDVDNTPS